MSTSVWLDLCQLGESWQAERDEITAAQRAGAVKLGAATELITAKLTAYADQVRKTGTRSHALPDTVPWLALAELFGQIHYGKPKKPHA